MSNPLTSAGRGLFGELTRRGVIAAALLGAVLLVLPLLNFVPVLGDWRYWGYIASIVIFVLYLSMVGQAWNLMLGFAGLLSIGHALFVGVGAYTAAYLFARQGVPPIIGVFAAILLASLVGILIGYLGFRFSVRGVHFALLTIAFAEFTRILVDHAGFLGAAEGLFLPIKGSEREGVNLLTLRGRPEMFYYLMVVLCFGTLALCRYLLRSKVGYYWQAIRDDQEAAEAVGINVFRYKMYAVVVSSAISGVAGVFIAFYNNNLFPDSTFGIERSIEFTLAPIVGGVGTLFGPIFGAFILTPLGEILNEVIELLKAWGVIDPKAKLNGLKLLIWGLFVMLIVLFRPKGLWPWFRDGLRLVKTPAQADPGPRTDKKSPARMQPEAGE
jgi:branched-chain amino acid transport system permease protein